MTNVTAIVVPVEQDRIKINELAQTVFEQNKALGWWTNIETGEVSNLRRVNHRSETSLKC